MSASERASNEQESHPTPQGRMMANEMAEGFHADRIEKPELGVKSPLDA
jgi:hypothetical protein